MLQRYVPYSKQAEKQDTPKAYEDKDALFDELVSDKDGDDAYYMLTDCELLLKAILKKQPKREAGGTVYPFERLAALANAVSQLKQLRIIG